MFFLVVRRTLARGWRKGLTSGLGVATGRPFLGEKPHPDPAYAGNPATLTTLAPTRGRGKVAGAYASMLALTLSNPVTIWWVALTAIISAARERLTPRVTRGIALVSRFAVVVIGALITLQSL